jgi:release factor glutamine methyltransferase
MSPASGFAVRASSLGSMLTRSTTVDRLRAAGCVFAEDEADLLIAEARTAHDLAGMVDARVAGLPLEQILGWAEFCGLRIVVEPGIFVPRRRTEFLAEHAIAIARRVHRPQPVVVDLCCGSGAIGAALLAALDRIDLFAVDIDPAEVRCARRNVVNSAQVFAGDLYDPLPSTLHGDIDVLIANAPYVPTEAVALMPPEARDHEARVALDGGADGLDILRRVIDDAPRWLAPGGHLLVETSESQAPALVEAFQNSGLRARVVGSEELGATIVIGTRAQPSWAST